VKSRKIHNHININIKWFEKKNLSLIENSNMVIYNYMGMKKATVNMKTGTLINSTIVCTIS